MKQCWRACAPPAEDEVAETVGSLADKISILELKIWHMREQSARDDAAPAFHTACEQHLEVLRRQRDDLAEELSVLLSAITAGRVESKVYHQFKMYNDPQYRRPSV
jgi:hypothetical protein